MKKLMSILLAMIMVLGLSSVALAAPDEDYDYYICTPDVGAVLKIGEGKFEQPYEISSYENYREEKLKKLELRAYKNYIETIYITDKNNYVVVDEAGPRDSLGHPTVEYNSTISINNYKNIDKLIFYNYYISYSFENSFDFFAPGVSATDSTKKEGIIMSVYNCSADFIFTKQNTSTPNPQPNTVNLVNAEGITDLGYKFIYNGTITVPTVDGDNHLTAEQIKDNRVTFRLFYPDGATRVGNNLSFEDVILHQENGIITQVTIKGRVHNAPAGSTPPPQVIRYEVTLDI